MDPIKYHRQKHLVPSNFPMMSSSIHFHYDPFTKFDHIFDNAINVRFWPSSSIRARCATTSPNKYLNLFRPIMDVNESKDANTVTATFELPGSTPEDVSIDLQQNRLTVSGESTVSNTHEGEGYVVRERRYGKFSRTLQLPFGTKAEDVKAKLENGLLTVTFPRATPEQQLQRIAIQ
ncbi:small heat shock protein [Imleria badia]|nr:small heat shock protein [Imleria badia]